MLNASVVLKVCVNVGLCAFFKFYNKIINLAHRAQGNHKFIISAIHSARSISSIVFRAVIRLKQRSGDV